MDALVPPKGRRLSKPEHVFELCLKGLLEVLLEPIMTAYPRVHPVTDRHHYVREAALRLLMLGIRDTADILRLVALPARHIPLNPVLVFSFPRLVSLLLGLDPVESPGAFAGCMVKSAALDSAV